MPINPADISTIRVGQLPIGVWSLDDKLAHEISNQLTQGSVQGLADLISDYIGTSSSLAFNPTTVSDGETLPATDSNEWILVGKGTFGNVGGAPDITTTEELNALTSNGSFWQLSVQIPINVELAGIVQTVRSGFTTTTPSENAVYDALLLKANVDDIPDFSLKEDKINKQNDLTPDGSGTKYPTVDAVNLGFLNKQNNLKIVNVEYFGAIGDGTTDNTLFIQNAVDSLSDNDVLYFPPGEFKTNQISIDAKNGFTFTGKGTLSITAGTSQAILNITNSSNITVDSLGFKGLGNVAFDNTYKHAGIYVSTSSFTKIKNCNFNEFNNQAIFANNLTGGTFTEGLHILNSNFTDFYYDSSNSIDQYAIYLGADGEYSTISGNNFYRVVGAVKCNDGANTIISNNIIMQSKYDNNSGTWSDRGIIYCDNNSNNAKIFITNNRINHNDGNVIAIVAKGGGNQPQYTISENHLLLNGDGSYAFGIAMYNTIGSIVNNNYILPTGGGSAMDACVYLYRCVNTMIYGNFINGGQYAYDLVEGITRFGINSSINYSIGEIFHNGVVDEYKTISSFNGEIDSPHLIGIPTTPTATAGTNTTQIASTAFVSNAVSSAVTGTGTANRLAKFSSSNVLSNSIIYESGSNIGIGSSPTYKFDLGNGAGLIRLGNLFYGSNGGSYPTIGYNAVPDSVANAWNYSASDIASWIQFQPDIKLFTASSGTAGASITPVERASVSSSGVLKVNNLAGTGSSLIEADSSGNISRSLSSARPYKSYVALITQTGTSAPTVVVLENNLSGAIVWARTGVGVYTGTLSGAFTSNKAVCFATLAPVSVNFKIGIVSNSVNTVQIAVVDGTNTPQDNVLNTTSIEIRVYN